MEATGSIHTRVRSISWRDGDRRPMMRRGVADIEHAALKGRLQKRKTEKKREKNGSKNLPLQKDEEKSRFRTHQENGGFGMTSVEPARRANGRACAT